MIKLTKQFRIWWDDNKIIQNDWTQEYSLMSETMKKDNAFDSDNLQDIKNKIIELELKPKDDT